MTPQANSDDVETDGIGREERRQADEERVTLCIVCQQPLGSGSDSRWRGEPVHHECAAELRCGVTIGERHSE